jgi:DNA-binding HxlR family transcriptional regulator
MSGRLRRSNKSEKCPKRRLRPGLRISRETWRPEIRVYVGPHMRRSLSYEQKIDFLHDHCPVRAALDVIRGRWKPSILCELKSGPKRFSELLHNLAAANAQVLTLQLRQLEADGVISRRVTPEVPVRVEYALTREGKRLSRVMQALEDWGSEYLKRHRKEACAAR